MIFVYAQSCETTQQSIPEQKEAPYPLAVILHFLLSRTRDQGNHQFIYFSLDLPYFGHFL